MSLAYYKRIKNIRTALRHRDYSYVENYLTQPRIDYILTTSVNDVTTFEIMIKHHPQFITDYIIPLINSGSISQDVLKIRDVTNNSSLMILLKYHPTQYSLIEDFLQINPTLVYDALNNDNITPLGKAIQLGNLQLIKLLLVYHSDIEFVRPDMSALLYAKHIKASPEIIKKLEEETIRQKKHTSVSRFNNTLPLSDVLYFKAINKKVQRGIRYQSKRKKQFEKLLSYKVMHSQMCFGKNTITLGDQYKMARYYGVENYTTMDLEQTCKAVAQRLLQIQTESKSD